MLSELGVPRGSKPQGLPGCQKEFADKRLPSAIINLTQKS
jgi:hypothetical protein